MLLFFHWSKADRRKRVNAFATKQLEFKEGLLRWRDYCCLIKDVNWQEAMLLHTGDWFSGEYFRILM
jgi:hypothetical protein